MAVIQLRSGAYADYDPAKMHAAEVAVILSGDPETADGKSMRIAFGAGDDKRLLTEDDALDVDAELDALSENPVQNKALKSALDAKAPTASPAFTGTPTVPNAAAGTNTQQIASTKFVHDAVTSKAPIASPAFTGTPTAPTAAAGTNNTQIATTAFVKTAIDAVKQTLTATDKGSGVVSLSIV